MYKKDNRWRKYTGAKNNKFTYNKIYQMYYTDKSSYNYFLNDKNEFIAPGEIEIGRSGLSQWVYFIKEVTIDEFREDRLNNILK